MDIKGIHDFFGISKFGCGNIAPQVWQWKFK